MAGHSHWHNVQRRKGAVDAEKGKIFGKLARNIIVAARQGGGDPDMNLALQYAVDKAKAVSMPKDKIERAIKKGTGDLAGAQYEGMMYEAIGPGGGFVLMEILTDNRNRTASEIRKVLEKKGARMGSVAWAFEQKGLITVPCEGAEEDEVLEVVLEAGGEDMERVGDCFQITTLPAELERVRRLLVERGITIESAELSRIASTPNPVDEETGRKVLSLLETLEDHDDVQNVFSNVELPEELLAEVSAG